MSLLVGSYLLYTKTYSRIKEIPSYLELTVYTMSFNIYLQWNKKSRITCHDS